MFWHLILGLLRDGQQRHGYELVTLYKTRTGTHVSPGNFYRDLTRLTSDGLVETGVNPPEADSRRIPYQITAKGRQEFDEWLLSPRDDGDLTGWILFADRVPPEVREEVIDRRLEELWLRNKILTRTRDDALRERAEAPDGGYDPLPVLISREMKRISAELEFLEEFRVELASHPVEEGRGKSASAPSSQARPNRTKGAPRS